MKFPDYYGWSNYMAKKPGESSVNYVKRLLIWDAVIEGEITYADVAQR